MAGCSFSFYGYLNNFLHLKELRQRKPAVKKSLAVHLFFFKYPGCSKPQIPVGHYQISDISWINNFNLLFFRTTKYESQWLSVACFTSLDKITSNLHVIGQIGDSWLMKCQK